MAKVNKKTAPQQAPQKLAGRAQVFVTTDLAGTLVYLLPDRVLALVNELGGDLKYQVGANQMTANELIAAYNTLQESEAVLRDQLQDMIDSNEAYIDLKQAVADVYFSAHWTPDRDVNEDLWSRLRDAAGIKPGQSPKPVA